MKIWLTQTLRKDPGVSLCLNVMVTPKAFVLNRSNDGNASSNLVFECIEGTVDGRNPAPVNR